MRLLRPFSLRAPSGGRLFGLIARPHTPGPHPAVFLLPGALGSGLRMAASPGAARLVAAGMVVVGFNAAGRGSGRPWDPRSTGTPDLNGPRDQDALAAVIRSVADKRWVDEGNLGLYAVSYGLVAATGCLVRHPDLPIRYLVDEEGPSDRFAALLRAWTIAETEAPDWPARAAALFGHPTSDDAFWSCREPMSHIRHFTGRYLRLQAAIDHVQPPHREGLAPLFHRPPLWWRNKHAITMVNAAVEGSPSWVGINLPALSNPADRKFSIQSPPRYLPGRLSETPTAWTASVLLLSGCQPGLAPTG